jgi:hypothetical protein
MNLIEWMPRNITSTAVLAIIITGILYFVQTRYRQGLRQVPGPFLASFLPAHRILTTALGQQYAHHIKYHERYGSMVRVGPNHVSLSNAGLIPVIYGITTKFHKASHLFLPAWQYFSLT